METIDAGFQKILPINKPSVNGRIYSENIVLKALKNVKSLPVVLYNNEFPGYIPFDSMGGIANEFKITDDYVYGNIKFFNTAQIRHFLENKENTFSFSLTGTGEVINNEVINYKPTFVSLTVK